LGNLSGNALADPAITISNAKGVSELGNPPFTLGWEFEANAAVVVTELGIFDDSQDGLSDSYPIGIWDSTGHLLASAIVASGTTDPLIDQFRYHSIGPILLAAGHFYSIGALYATSHDPLIFPGTATGFASDPAITFTQAAFASGASLSNPTSSAGPQPGFFGPNFVLNPSVIIVPEPMSPALVGVALVGLAIARRRKPN